MDFVQDYCEEQRGLPWTTSDCFWYDQENHRANKLGFCLVDID